jgi:hypothetical protein
MLPFPWGEIFSIAGFALLLAVVVAGAISKLAASRPPRVCPLCGSDLAEWAEYLGVRNGYEIDVLLHGCPKRRDKGAGEPPGARPWSEHYAVVVKSRRVARFT